MCFPKAPKTDPEILRAQREQKRLELERLAEEKRKRLKVTKRTGLGSGARSLISGSDESGFGANY